jgi:hypothetical protein
MVTDSGSQSTSKDITVSVSQPTGGMYVSDIGWKETGPHLKATVTIMYTDGSSASAVSGASVDFELTDGSETKTYTGTTDNDGIVEFQWKKASSGTYTGTVTDITHSSYTWDSSLDMDNPDDYTKT